MASLNPFDLLGDNDTDDPALLVPSQPQKIEPKKTLGSLAKPAASASKATVHSNLPSKPLPPTEAVRESKLDSARGGRGGPVKGRAITGTYIDFSGPTPLINMNMDITTADRLAAGKSSERLNGPPYSYRGARQGVVSNGEYGGERDHPRRTHDRRSGTGRGNGIKREGGGRGNWGNHTDDLTRENDENVNESEKTLDGEKPSGESVAAADGDKEAAAIEVEEKPEDKEMTLEEYEKLLEEKRKALLALKTEERKVDAKEFASMQPLSNKKANDEIFIKLSSDKDKKKELAEKEERAKKSVSINEFLKPAEGEKYYSPGGRGRGRGRGGPRGGYSGGSETNYVKDLAIEDPGQFPTLGGK